MSYDPLLTLLGLATLANPLAPARFNNNGIGMTADTLPVAPLMPTLAIDSEDGNKLKWWDGTQWNSAGGSGAPAGADRTVQFNDNGSFGSVEGLTYTPDVATGFDLNLTRTYDETAVASNNAGTLSVLLNLDPITAPSGSNLAALFVQNQLTDATGMASRAGRIYGQYTRVLDTGFTGTAWDGEMSGHFVEVVKSGPTAGAVNGIRLNVQGGSTSSMSGANIYVEKSYTSNPGSVRGIAIAVESAATGTITQAFGLQITSVGSDTDTGTIGTSYGVYIGTTSGANVTDAYGLFQADANALNSFAGRVLVSASTADRAGLNLPHGVAPTTPEDGDIWSTTSGFYGRVNGVTVGPFGTGGGSGGAAGDSEEIQYNDGSDGFAASPNFKWRSNYLELTNRIELHSDTFPAEINFFTPGNTSRADIVIDGTSNSLQLLCGNGNLILDLPENTGLPIKSYCDVAIPSDKAYYLGDPDTDGSWRVQNDTGNLTFQKRVSGTWQTQFTLGENGLSRDGGTTWFDALTVNGCVDTVDQSVSVLGVAP